MKAGGWRPPEGPVGAFIADSNARTLRSYEIKPELVHEHANIERSTAQGGYGHRQLYELIQNGADAIAEADGQRGRIAVLLTPNALYCANQGKAIDVDGVRAILSSHVSRKRGAEIGRFGLGFKSVLGVTSRPLFLSRSGSFSFDSDWAATEIARVLPGQDRYPVLRLARPVDPEVEASADPVLASLMDWAATVVKMPLDADAGSWLEQDLLDFPAEFLLFSPHVHKLQLAAANWKQPRDVRLQTDGDHLSLLDGDERSRWQVFTEVHTPSEQARADAGELSDRGELPLAWAVPLEGRRERGHFWAFFPTEYRMTLAGILNAPWKTNEDRQNLLPGEFNEELLRAASRLVGRALPQLVDEDDPGKHLELLPARDKMQWADEYLADEIDRAVADMPVMPDQDGRLRRPEELLLCPPDLPAEALQLWEHAPDRPTGWCHHSVSSRVRWAKAERLVGGAASVSRWVSAVACASTPENSVVAIQIVDVSARHGNVRRRTVQELEEVPAVLTEKGQLVQIRNDQLFLASDADMQALPGTHLVHREVAAIDTVREILTSRGVKMLEGADHLPQLIAALRGGGRFQDWPAFWKAVRMASSSSRDDLSGVRSRLRVRTRAGTWQPTDRVLLPGRIVGEDDADAPVTVDTEYHAPDLPLFGELGVVDEPVAECLDPRTQDWFHEYRASCVERFQLQARESIGSTPQGGLIDVLGRRIAGPLGVFKRLRDEHKPAYTELLLRAQSQATWKVRHRTQEKYGTLEVLSPVDWYLLREGWIETTLGPRPAHEALPPALGHLGTDLAVATCSVDIAQRLDLPTRVEDLLDEEWQSVFSAVERLEDIDAIGATYAAACRHTSPPRMLRCRHRDGWVMAPTSSVVVTASRDLVSLLAVDAGVILAPDEPSVLDLSEAWGLGLSEDVHGVDVHTAPDGEPFYFGDLYPDLAALVGPEGRDLLVQPCRQVRVTLSHRGDTISEARVVHVENGAAYVVLGDDEAHGLHALLAALGRQVDEERIRESIEGRVASELAQLREQVNSEPDIGKKLELAVGMEALRAALPPSLRVGHDDLGRVVLAVFGVESLREFRNVLQEREFAPPRTWAGSPAARQFVQELGFPEEYAGFPKAELAPWLEVLGKPILPKLHPFQRTISRNVESVLEGAEGLRGLVSLPTGAGKTRVAVESWIRHHGDTGWEFPLLWVAQTEELCEQAVQTWSYVWRATGPDHRLTISRLWSTRQAAALEGNHIVVVTIQKLTRIAKRADPRYEWLRRPAGVIIDEAHGSITTSYTQLLRWLGFGYGASRTADRVPLLGLTATPFRGFDSDETERLAARYDRRLLNTGVFRSDPYQELQDMQVLARVRHDQLMGAELSLDQNELDELERFQRLPRHVEERLGLDTARNDRIVTSISQLPEDWTVLVFATSVEHAKILAALLSLRGIPSAPIWGETPVGARRHYIREFRAGRLRVLTNYNVLAEGFDAPAVRAVYVARPTWSPNRYQQMVGRGLRGPLNGGKEECLIVDVADNVERFQRKLAFRHFEYLWDPHREYLS